MKKCKCCGVEKSLESFHRQTSGKFGRRSHCKSCRTEANKNISPENRLRKRELANKRCQDPVLRAKAKALRELPRNMLRRNKRNRELYKDPVKRFEHKARQAVYYALKTGKLESLPCERCGELKVEAHHWSYLEEHRLDVVWLCNKHHNEEHARIRKDELQLDISNNNN